MDSRNLKIEKTQTLDELAAIERTILAENIEGFSQRALHLRAATFEIISRRRSELTPLAD